MATAVKKAAAKAQQRHSKAAAAASALAPEAKAASVAATAKVKAASSTAKAGEKTVAKRGAPSSERTSPPTPEKKKEEVSQKRSASQRAVSSTAAAGKRRVDSARQSHRKTQVAVESKKRKEKVLGLAELRPKTRMLAAEYMAAIVMAIILLFLHKEGEGYHKRMSRFFIQMTGITGIFFVLALMASSEKASRYVIPFGLLIDVSMLVYLFKNGAADVFDTAVGTERDDYKQILDTEIQSHPSKPGEVVPGITTTPDTPTIGGLIGGGPLPPNGNQPVRPGH